MITPVPIKTAVLGQGPINRACQIFSVENGKKMVDIELHFEGP